MKTWIQKFQKYKVKRWDPFQKLSTRKKSHFYDWKIFLGKKTTSSITNLFFSFFRGNKDHYVKIENDKFAQARTPFSLFSFCWFVNWVALALSTTHSIFSSISSSLKLIWMNRFAEHKDLQIVIDEKLKTSTTTMSIKRRFQEIRRMFRHQ